MTNLEERNLEVINQELAAAKLPLGKVFSAVTTGVADLPASLCGATGTNRALADVCQLAANNDLQAVQAWLAEYIEQKQTLRAYTKEAERLLLWCWLEVGKPLSSLTRQDFTLYQQFLADPQPASRWQGNSRAPRHSKDWRPFQKGLSPASQQQTFRVLKGLFNYLHQASYLAGNPLALMKTTNPRHNAQQVRQRHLDQDTWQALIDFVQQLTSDEPQEQAEIERWRLLLAFLYLLAPRVHEVAQAKVQDFFKKSSGWWWAVEGKGKKYAEIPVNPALIKVIKNYRKFMGLPPSLAPEDASPLVLNLAGTQGISANMVYRSMKKLTDLASQELAASQPEIAQRLAKTSTHWFRHTSITHQADAGVELRFLARNARHANLATTRIYMHEDDEAWQEEAKKQTWQGW